MSETTNEDVAYIIGLQEENKRLREEFAAMTVEVDRLERNAIDQRAELITRDLVIEQMRDAIQALMAAKDLKNACGKTSEYEQMKIIAWGKAAIALATQPSTAALKLRDQHRDSALLRVVSKNNDVSTTMYLERLASYRESGEWEPELEIK